MSDNKEITERDELFAALTHAATDFLDQNGCKPTWWTPRISEMTKKWANEKKQKNDTRKSCVNPVIHRAITIPLLSGGFHWYRLCTLEKGEGYDVDFSWVWSEVTCPKCREIGKLSNLITWGNP
jgi:hypothetical protein